MDQIRKTIRNRVTRMKIGETIVHLLDHVPLQEIKIATISKLTGISRMTFYHYYDSTETALMDYLTEIISLYQQELINHGLIDKFHSIAHLEFTFRFFARYDQLILKLERIGLYKYVVDCVNTFFEREYSSYFKDHPYDLYFYSGGIMSVYMHWIHHGKKETPRALARRYASIMNTHF